MPIDSAEARALLERANLSPSLSALAARGEWRSFRKGKLLMEEGERGDELYLVVAGQVRAFSVGPNDRELTFGIYGPGDCVGEMSLDGGPRSASVVTTEPTTCVLVARHTLRQHIACDPDFALELIARVIGRARLATRNARSIALLDVYSRVAQLLDSLAVAQADGTRVIETRLTHADIASRVGCSREMVSRLMKDLVAGDYIAAGPGRLQLLRPLPSRW